MPDVAFVIVSHSESLARGVCELAAQMAPDVHFEAAGGTDPLPGETHAALGTSYDKVEAALGRALDVAPGGAVLVSDLGSATMTIESVVEFADEPERVRFVDAPLVEGTVAAAVRAQLGDPLEAVAQAAIDAGLRYAQVHAPALTGEQAYERSAGDSVLRVKGIATIADPVGLHARPAAVLARVASRFDAEVTIEDADATSVLELMALGVSQGQDVTVAAEGPEAVEALAAVIATLEDPEPSA
ncbi:dihydroxyacetone kinase phosphoryl donor subunit DhaM [Schaalia canis]|uniref:Phosphocarrier protein HPr n=1 Tax=Schaalia canis TaxID=100469 RepID=A0A3P1SD00_9ACTO|nr:dihydroxyacetone kinase phosphoryl donor subunit DhaM [Schaalia canis]RRC95173.1 HPr family phosphocarrier protein [Schaalia canis]